MIVIDLPIISSAEYPNSRSAPGFQLTDDAVEVLADDGIPRQFDDIGEELARTARPSTFGDVADRRDPAIDAAPRIRFRPVGDAQKPRPDAFELNFVLVFDRLTLENPFDIGTNGVEALLPENLRGSTFRQSPRAEVRTSPHRPG